MIEDNQPENIVPEGSDKKNKKVKESYALKAQHFQKKTGLRALYQMSKKINLQNGDINIDNTMKKIVVALKTWHFGLIPKYNYDYFLQRCQVLGTGKLLQAYMSKVRRIHKGLDNWIENQQIEQDKTKNINRFTQSLELINKMNQNINQKKIGIQSQNYDDYLLMVEHIEKKNKINKQQQQDGVQIQQNDYVNNNFYDDYE